MDIVVEVLSQLETLTITKEALEVCSISAIQQNTIILLRCMYLLQKLESNFNCTFHINPCLASIMISGMNVTQFGEQHVMVESESVEALEDLDRLPWSKEDDPDPVVSQVIAFELFNFTSSFTGLPKCWWCDICPSDSPCKAISNSADVPLPLKDNYITKSFYVYILGYIFHDFVNIFY